MRRALAQGSGEQRLRLIALAGEQAMIELLVRTQHGLIAQQHIQELELRDVLGNRVVQAQLALAVGDLATVQRWATGLHQHKKTLPLFSYEYEQEELLIARDTARVILGEPHPS